MEDLEDRIYVGDRVSWKSQITDRRHLGTVVAVFDDTHEYRIRGAQRVCITLPAGRITKECN